MSNIICSYRQLGRLVMVVLILSLCIACFSEITTTKNPESLLATKSRTPDISGVVIDLYTANEHLNGFYIEGVLDDYTKYDKASVKVNEETRVFRVIGDTYEMVTTQEIKKEQIVEVIFVPGEILERYPVSAEAQEILIISQEN